MVATVTHIEVVADPPALAARVAEWMTAAATEGEGRFCVALSGGSTPKALYALLASDNFRSRFPWQRVLWFWGDERFVPHDDPASNYRMAYDVLFSRVPVSKDRIHAIQTEGVSPERAAANYQMLLQGYYGKKRFDVERPIFDVTLLGVGENGHTASFGSCHF